MNDSGIFHRLHQQQHPLIIGNVWDAASAKMFEKAGYQAIATSSAAIAHSLGYPDGERMPFDLLLRIVRNIAENTTLPLSVDMEAGYAGSTDKLLENIERLMEAGVAGINFEDCMIGQKQLKPMAEAARAISGIANHVNKNNLRLFINARTDAYLMRLPSAFDETIARSKAYENAGANGIFVPCLVDRHEITTIVSNTSLPLNVMCMPGLPSFAELGSMGVKRISMASFVYHAMKKFLGHTIQQIKDSDSFDPLFRSTTLDGLTLKDLID